MKKYYFTSILLALSTLVFAQSANPLQFKIAKERTKPKEFKNKQKDLYNHWSIDLNVGSNKAIEPFASGYFASDPNRFSNIGLINHYGLGVRYMASNIFGLKVGLGYDKISNISTTTSPEFKLSLYTASFEGVLNLGRLARFETFTNRLNLLVHGGLQTTYKTVDERLGVTPGSDAAKEQDGGIVIGVTPMYRLNNRLSLTADFSSFTNFRQHINWDGSKNYDKNLNGSINTMTLGLIINFGNSDKQAADWFIVPTEDLAGAETKKRLEEVEKLTVDTDKDGVPDFRDAQNNTPAGIVVDSKGRFLDANKNGSPDETENIAIIPVSKDGSVVSNTATIIEKGGFVNTDTSFDATKQFIEKGYLNVFFNTSSDQPNQGSSSTIYQIIKYLKDNPETKVKLIGRADPTGDMAANKDLSERRAKSLFNLIKGSGVDGSRIRIEGGGEDNQFLPGSAAGNNIARRVSVVLE